MVMAAIDLKLNSTCFCESEDLNKIVNLNPTMRPLAISEIPPLQAAFLIDHILEKIFSKLDTVSVKSCRLVSPRWKEFGAIELQKRVSINLAFAYVSVEDVQQNHNGDQVLINCCLPQPSNSPSRPGADNTTNNSLSIPSLLSLIEHSTTNFPCDTFVISTETLGSSQIQNILSTIGPLMRSLRLSVILYSQKSSFQENSLFRDLKRLLSDQAPFMKSFDLKVKLPYHWKEEMTKADFNSKFFKSNSSPGKMYLPNLKSLTLLDELPHSFCHEILDSAVNLTEFNGTHFGTYFTEQNGKYRIHLLRHFHFAMYSDSQCEIVTQLLRQSRNILKLESIRITVTKSFFEDDGFSTTRERQESSVHTLSDLLEMSAKTLKKLTLEPLRSLPGIRFPQMPKLQSLVLVTRSTDSVLSSFDKHFFPQGFSVSVAFPGLLSISVLCPVFGKDFDRNVRRLVQVAEPLPGVSFLRVALRNRISEETVKILSKNLPNAILCNMTEEDRREREAFVKVESLLYL